MISEYNSADQKKCFLSVVNVMYMSSINVTNLFAEDVGTPFLALWRPKYKNNGELKDGYDYLAAISLQIKIDPDVEPDPNATDYRGTPLWGYEYTDYLNWGPDYLTLLLRFLNTYVKEPNSPDLDNVSSPKTKEIKEGILYVPEVLFNEFEYNRSAQNWIKTEHSHESIMEGYPWKFEVLKSGQEAELIQSPGETDLLLHWLGAKAVIVHVKTSRIVYKNSFMKPILYLSKWHVKKMVAQIKKGNE